LGALIVRTAFPQGEGRRFGRRREPAEYFTVRETKKLAG
jgi:hypothetical protein